MDKQPTLLQAAEEFLSLYRKTYTRANGSISSRAPLQNAVAALNAAMRAAAPQPPSASGERDVLNRLAALDTGNHFYTQVEVQLIKDARDTLAPSPGIDAAEQERERGLDAFNACGGNNISDPLERLRFFCSLVMKTGQDWLDIEPFFEALAAPPAAQPSAEWMEQAEDLLDDYLGAVKSGTYACRFDARSALLAHLRTKP